MKRIIVCCDGTSQDDVVLPGRLKWWHDPLKASVRRFASCFGLTLSSVDKMRRAQEGASGPSRIENWFYNYLAGEVKAPSNMTLLARAIATTATTDDGKKIPQIVIYQPGIGTTGLFFSRLRQQAIATDMAYKVRQAYGYIVHNYERPKGERGDDIIMFGFSRGAFTARSVAGFIEWAGVLRKEQMEHFDDLWDAYKNGGENPDNRHRFARLNNREELLDRHTDVYVRCLGVFDTVAALGFPSFRCVDDETVPEDARRAQSFFDVDLGEHVDHAFQALALDEHRRDFYPAVWKVLKPESYVIRNKPHEPVNQVVEQTWFAGSHSDIGGGYLTHGLSDVTLKWMVQKCEENKLLEFDDDFLQKWMSRSKPKKHYLDTPQDSSYPLKIRCINRHPGLFPPSLSSAEAKNQDKKRYIQPSEQRLHQSVIDRIEDEDARVRKGKLARKNTCLRMRCTLRTWGFDEWIKVNKNGDWRLLSFPDHFGPPRGGWWKRIRRGLCL
ncbi:hypothetical protein YB2330_003195 [Saitoella coloradoensis]